MYFIFHFKITSEAVSDYDIKSQNFEQIIGIVTVL